MGWELAVLGKLGATGITTGVNMYNSIEAGQAAAQSTAMNAAAQASNMRMQGATIAANSELSAINSDAQADYYLEQAGGFQLQGRQEREIRGIQLGQDIGEIEASAAGSGISVDSRMVQKTVQDTRTSAYNDMIASAANEYANVSGAMRNSKIARVNAQNQRTIGNWANSAYSSLAGSIESAGTIAANNQLKAGYNAAIGNAFSGISSMFGG